MGANNVNQRRQSGESGAPGRRINGTLVGVVIGLLALGACAGRPPYFQDAVNEANQDMVGKRYGSPHKRQSASDGGEIWTYFERGSGTAGFGGHVRGGSCRSYVLTFDQQAVLRQWAQQPCQG